MVCNEAVGSDTSVGALEGVLGRNEGVRTVYEEGKRVMVDAPLSRPRFKGAKLRGTGKAGCNGFG
jgi:hypothetical protein